MTVNNIFGILQAVEAGIGIATLPSYLINSSTGVVPVLAERAHQRIRAIHDEHDIPYVYGEWRTMLQDVLNAAPPMPG